MKTFKFTIPEFGLTRVEKEGKKRIGAPVVQAWMLLLGLFWMFRFWAVKEETIRLFTLDVYRGEETIDLITVSLGRDGILYLAAGIFLLAGYARVVYQHTKETKLEPDDIVKDEAAPHRD
ncbi:MAG: hypothetical protein AAFY98_02230 [Verrucomicrobiota bacterium]